LFNVRAGVSTKNFELYFWGRNLGNQQYIAYAYDFGAVHLGDPKTYGITFRASFK
jgi:iron complex outermembrane receptor protein